MVRGGRKNIFSTIVDKETLGCYLLLAINRTPHFGVWSALTPTLKFRGVWITAPALTPALHLLLQKPNFVKKN